jgi:hypothetical protein
MPLARQEHSPLSTTLKVGSSMVTFDTIPGVPKLQVVNTMGIKNTAGSSGISDNRHSVCQYLYYFDTKSQTHTKYMGEGTFFLKDVSVCDLLQLHSCICSYCSFF